jgi:hypothetical protein
MAPTKEELEAGEKEEAEAMLAFSAALRKGTKAQLEITKTRKRLQDARGAKRALYSDMMSFGGAIKSSVPMKV